MIFPKPPKFISCVIRRLKDAGNDAFIVGGTVRDVFLKRPITDWDVATSASPDEIIKLFRDVRFFSQKHGTVTLIDESGHYDVTTFRAARGTIDSDLARRDFTVNAMAFDPEKEVLLDPFHAWHDINKKSIKAVGEPHRRFFEDPLRLLRAVRLSLELGFGIEEKTFASMRENAFRLEYVAPERVREELIRILMVGNPSRGFNMMVRAGLLDRFLPELMEGYLMRQNRYHMHTVFKHVMVTVDSVRPEPVLRLAALLHDIAKPRVRRKKGGEWRFLDHEKASTEMAGEILDRLRFSRSVTARVMNIIENHMICYSPQWRDGTVRRLIKRVGDRSIRDLLEFRRADVFAHGIKDHKIELLEELENRVRRIFQEDSNLNFSRLVVNGNDVMKLLKLESGPEVGKILEQLSEMVMDNPELNDRKILFTILENMK